MFLQQKVPENQYSNDWDRNQTKCYLHHPSQRNPGSSSKNSRHVNTTKSVFLGNSSYQASGDCLSRFPTPPPGTKSGPPSLLRAFSGEDSLTPDILAQDIIKPMGDTGSEWVQAGPQVSAKPTLQASDGFTEPGAVRGHSRGSGETPGERGYRGSTQSGMGILLPAVSGTEKRPGGNATCDQPPSSEQFPSSSTLQDGGDSCGEGPPTTGGLADKDRLEGRILCHPHASSRLEVSKILVAKESFQFTCLPFSLSSAPRVFTKVLRPIIAFLRRKGVRCVIYIDDILLMHQDKDKLAEITASAVRLLESLGFLVNYIKSVLTPIQRLIFLGFMIDSIKRELRLPTEKLSKLVKEVRKTLNLRSVSARYLAKLIGKMSATIQAVRPAPLNYRSIQQLKHAALRRGGYDGQIGLNQESHRDLEWWASNLSKWNGRPLQELSPELTIETDASMMGWGAFCQGVMTGGCWSQSERAQHINLLEMQAAFFAIKAFAKNRQGISILIRSDNQSVVAHINKMGGTRSPRLTAQVKELWSWCLQRQISVQAQHLPGVENVMADYLSRHLMDRTDWVLDPNIFSCLNDQLGPLDVDLFATRFSNQLPRFFSWRPDPEAEATDAFTQDWSNILGFAHPPWCLIPRVLRKVRSEETSLVLVAPLWESQAWFPDLVEMLMEIPIELPSTAEVITPSPNCDCPVRDAPLRLVACKVSGKDSDLLEFRRKQSSSSWPHGGTRPTQTMIQCGKYGNLGAQGKEYIPLRQIFPVL